jgi:subtilisin family serine protease
VTWAISDTGVDWDHPDLGSHIVGGYSPPDGDCIVPGQPGSDCPGGGHGTHVAGIVAGDASAGFTDVNGFLRLGMAPATSIFASTFAVLLADATGSPPRAARLVPTTPEHHRTAGVGYTADARLEDILVRDGNLDTPTVAEPFLQVFSAGNSGSGASTITEPKEAKNILSVANSLNARAGSIEAISSSSSRGPAIDGRTLPTITAPGSSIASTRNDTGGSCPDGDCRYQQTATPSLRHQQAAFARRRRGDPPHRVVARMQRRRQSEHARWRRRCWSMPPSTWVLPTFRTTTRGGAGSTSRG